jgi:hypothetical protein
MNADFAERDSRGDMTGSDTFVFTLEKSHSSVNYVRSGLLANRVRCIAATRCVCVCVCLVTDQ